MPNERQPPRASMSGLAQTDKGGQENLNSIPLPPSIPVKTATTGPPATSPASHPIQRTSNSHVFNIPKPGKPRPEHHHPDLSRSSVNYGIGFPSDFASSGPGGGGFAAVNNSSAYPATTGFQSANSSFHAVNQTTSTANPVSSNSTLVGEDGGFDPNKIPTDRRFGAPDINTYVSSEQATKDMKALLEGGFEDDEEGSLKLRVRRRHARRNDATTGKTTSQTTVSSTKNQYATDSEDDDEVEVEDGTVDGLAVKLLPHQVEGVAWMLDRENGNPKRNGVLPKGGILADDMGLGKTIQTIALLLTNPRPDPAKLAKLRVRSSNKSVIPTKVSKTTLVVAPLALIRQWESEIKEKVSADCPLSVRVHHGPSRTKKAAVLRQSDVVITTYQVLASELLVYDKALEAKQDGKKDAVGEDGVEGAALFGVYWYRVVLDEAHSIKNRSAKCTKASYALQSWYRWCLTGTPMQNSLDELQSLLQFLQVRPYCDRSHWTEQILGPMKSGRAGLAMRRLQYFLKAVMKRRTKDVLTKEGALTFGGKKAKAKLDEDGEPVQEFKIQPRTVEIVRVDFDEHERELYEKLSERARLRLDTIISNKTHDYIGALVLLLRLRQVCNHLELVGHSLGKDKDAVMTTGATNGSKNKEKDSQSSSAASSQEMDDIANMLGGLSVTKHLCEICQVELTEQHTKEKQPHCDDCAADLQKAKEAKSKQEKRRRDRLSRAGIKQDEEEEEKDEEEEGEEEAGTESEEETTPGLPFASTKIRRLLQILAKETPENKTIVFSEFTTMLDLVEPFLRQKGYNYVRYDGGMRNEHREASLARLREDPDTKILLCSLKCGGLGLNLTAACRVVLLEPFWNPFAEAQAIDRVHRLNQTKPVHVYRLTVTNTVEDNILKLQTAKQALANAALGGGVAGKKGGKGKDAQNKLSFDDILSLFGRDAGDSFEEGDGGLHDPTPKFSGYFSAPNDKGV